MIPAVESIIGVTFEEKALLEEALTHPSLNRLVEGRNYHYQRLELLGDSILGAVVSHLLYHIYPYETEGQLAQRKSALVSGKMLVKVMDTLGIAKHIIMSDGEIASGGQQNSSVKEDVCEALIGAIYLDQGYEAAFRFVEQHWKEAVLSVKAARKDAKTALQEHVQGMGLPLPEYKLIASEGAAHDPLFTVAVSVEGQVDAEGKAGSKRKAEQLAAAAMLELMGAV